MRYKFYPSTLSLLIATQLQMAGQARGQGGNDNFKLISSEIDSEVSRKNETFSLMSSELDSSASAKKSAESEKSLPVEVEADRLEYVGDDLVAEGNVVIIHMDDKLTADYVKVNPTTGDAYAKGNVQLTRGLYTWKGEEVNYNFKDGIGEFGEFVADAGAFHITAKDSKRISEHEIELTDATLTTCNKEDDHHYTVSVGKCILIDNHIIKAKNVVIRLGKVPIFYLPYIRRDLDGGLVNTQVGYSNDLGGFLRNRITYDLAEGVRAKTHVDYYSERGVGLGQDLRVVKDYGVTEFGFYYIKDVHGDDANNIFFGDPDYNEYDPDRYRFKFDSNLASKEDERDYLKARVNVWSDPDVVENYFNEEFNALSQPETNIALARSSDHSTAAISTVYQFSDAYESVNRLPELSLDLYNRFLPYGILYRSEHEIAFLEKRHNNYSWFREEYEALRLDTFHEVSKELDFADIFSVTPRASYRGSYYSHSQNEDGQYRNLFEVGTEASFRAYKVLSNKRSWYGDGLRHMIQPYVDYTFRPADDTQPANYYTGRPSEIYLFDEIDELDEAHDLRFGLRNVLQTRRDNGVRKFIDLDLYTTLDIEPDRRQNEFDTLHADFELWVHDHVNFEMDFEYDFYEEKFNPFNVRLNVDRDDGSFFRTEYRWREDFNHVVMAQASLWPERKYSLDAAIRYDLTDDEIEDSRIVLKRKIDCLGFGLGLRHEEDDNQIWLYMWIREFGEDMGGF